MALHGSFCPVAKASEILGEKWSILVLRELLMGTCRFADFQRAIARISPTMLSKRLKELEEKGMVVRKHPSGQRGCEYHLTAAGKALYPVVLEIASWGMKWARGRMTEDELDVDLLMWDMCRRIQTNYLPDCETVLRFTFEDMKPRVSWWVVIHAEGEIDMCNEDVGKDVDLYVTTDARTMIEIWQGDVSIAKAERDKRIKIVGDRQLNWFGFSMFQHIRPATAGEIAALDRRAL